MAVSGLITESMGAAIRGKSNSTASIFHDRFTSSGSRVRREGTIATSSSEKALAARLLRPMSYMKLSDPATGPPRRSS